MAGDSGTAGASGIAVDRNVEGDIGIAGESGADPDSGAEAATGAEPASIDDGVGTGGGVFFNSALASSISRRFICDSSVASAVLGSNSGSVAFSTSASPESAAVYQ